MDSELENAADSAPLTMIIDKLAKGVIINSNVYLTERQYNTLVTVDDNAVRCAVCAVICAADECTDHIGSDKHSKTLNLQSPMAKYELSIVRKAHQKYHCGVCNELFDLKAAEDHFATKAHENNLLFAINKVSDITYDVEVHKDGIEKVDSYHFSANTMNVDNLREDDRSSGSFYEEASPEMKLDNEYANRMTGECTSDVEEVTYHQFSYATVARTPKILPEFLEIEIKGRKMKVRFDSWHMIVTLKPNRFYCMVCKVNDHIVSKPAHCVGDGHLSKLEACTVVEKNDTSVIRKLDHRLCHCAHCNNLQLMSDIDDHIESKYPITRNKNIIDNIKQKNLSGKPNKARCYNKNTHKFQSGKNVINAATFNENGNTSTYPGNNESYLTNGRVLSEIKELYIFDCKFKLCLMSYNTVIRCNRYCCICDTTLGSDDISRHIKGISHTRKVNNTPFVYEFNVNLIRSVKNCLHCAICNEQVQYGLINKHVMEAAHMGHLKKIITLPIGWYLINNKIEKTNASKRTIERDSNNQFDILNRADDNMVTDIKKAQLIDVLNLKDGNDLESVHVHDEEEGSMNTEVFVLLKLKKLSFNITVASYNGLVPVGDSSRHCVLCAVRVTFDRLSKHVECRAHTDNIRKYKFLDKYENHLLRQIHHTYHCAQCNVVFNKSEMERHLSWPIHVKHMNNNKHLTNRSIEVVKSGKKYINVEFQKEKLHLTDIKPQRRVGVYYERKSNSLEGAVEKDKIVLYDGIVSKISWHAWHSFVTSKSGLKCSLCQMDLTGYELTEHVRSAEHLNRVDSFLGEYAPALIRTVNENTLNCVTCNTEVPNDGRSVRDHVQGRKHGKNQELIAQASTEAGTHADCDEKIFTLELTH